MRRNVVAGMTVLALLAGCGGGDDDGASDTTEESQDAGDAGGASDRSAEEELAASMVLRLSDLPAGWEAVPPEDEADDDEELSAELAACVGVESTAFDSNDHPKASSPTFTSTDDEEVESEVTFTPSEDEARESVALRRRDEFPGCYAEAVRSLVAKSAEDPDLAQPDLELGDPTVNPMSFPNLGDDTLAYRITIPFVADGTDIPVFLDVVAVGSGASGSRCPSSPSSHRSTATRRSG